jgi:nicotinamide-nucleotide amidase
MNKKILLAEIIAVGDEMTSGQRLDTNSQWIASQFNDLGIRVAFHSTVGDVLAQQTDVVRIAIARADVVVITGGLGPTKDDLTRQAVADAAGLELQFEPEVLVHIQKMFDRFQRKMSDANRVQAYFPIGSSIIDNPEGTAPGIDLAVDAPSPCRLFALPGVPAEMKQMWASHVEPAIGNGKYSGQRIFHHTLRCFGIGESEAESLLPNLMKRDREPRVGITASAATISFRIAAHANDESDFLKQIEPTIAEIKETLGDIVFGSGDDRLQDVVTRSLIERELSVAIADFEFGGNSARLLQSANEKEKGFPLVGHYSFNHLEPIDLVDSSDSQSNEGDNEPNSTAALLEAARQIRQTFLSNIGIAIGPLAADDESREAGSYHAVIVWDDEDDSEGIATNEFRYGGHSSMRETRSAKQVLNFLRHVLRAETA